MKRKTRQKLFLYRVEETNKKKQRLRHLAETKAITDEDARRKIIHKTIEEGGQIHVILPAGGDDPYPEEDAKRVY